MSALLSATLPAACAPLADGGDVALPEASIRALIEAIGRDDIGGDVTVEGDGP